MQYSFTCDICHTNRWKEHSLLLITCDQCGLVRARMNPTKEELDKAYEHDYFFGGEYANYFTDRPALEKNFRLRLKKLIPYFSTNSTVLEVGCSYGFFLNLCRPHVGRVIGYDITREGIDYVKSQFGLEAHCDTVLSYLGDPVDVVCLWDVMEHLPNPGEVMAKISTMVKSGGCIAFSTGDIGSLVARMRGDRWRIVHPPTHLFYFDRSSITQLLKNNGFQIIDYSHHAIYRNVGSVFEQLVRRNQDKRILSTALTFAHRVAKFVGLTKVNIGLNLYDIMDVIAVKK